MRFSAIPLGLLGDDPIVMYSKLLDILSWEVYRRPSAFNP